LGKDGFEKIAAEVAELDLYDLSRFTPKI